MTDRIKKPHVHAETAIEYAKDLLLDSEAWRGWRHMAQGENNWYDLASHPLWIDSTRYERKPKKVIKKFINGIEVPMHLTEHPKLGDTYYYVSLSYGVEIGRWANYAVDLNRFNMHNCYATVEDAQANLDAMIKFELREVEE